MKIVDMNFAHEETWISSILDELDSEVDRSELLDNLVMKLFERCNFKEKQTVVNDESTHIELFITPKNNKDIEWYSSYFSHKVTAPQLTRYEHFKMFITSYEKVFKLLYENL